MELTQTPHKRLENSSTFFVLIIFNETTNALKANCIKRVLAVLVGCGKKRTHNGCNLYIFMICTHIANLTWQWGALIKAKERKSEKKVYSYAKLFSKLIGFFLEGTNHHLNRKDYELCPFSWDFVRTLSRQLCLCATERRYNIFKHRIKCQSCYDCPKNNIYYNMLRKGVFKLSFSYTSVYKL